MVIVLDFLEKPRKEVAISSEIDRASPKPAEFQQNFQRPRLTRVLAVVKSGPDVMKPSQLETVRA